MDDAIPEVDGNMAAYVKQGASLEGQLVLLVFIAAIMGLGKGGVPGFATVATALTVLTAPTTVEGGLGYAVALQVPILTMIDISAAWLHYRKLDWRTVKILLPLSFVGMYIGQTVDKYLTDTSARLLVGTILLSILTFRLASKAMAANAKGGNTEEKTTAAATATSAPAPDGDAELGGGGRGGGDSAKGSSSCGTFGWAVVVGIFGGAATMLTNSMGPILNVYLLSVVKQTPEEYIGTRAMFFCFINLGKLPMRFASGTLGLQMLPLAAMLGVVSVVGVFCAKPIMLSMKEQTFVRLELAVVAFAGVRLCWMGLFP